MTDCRGERVFPGSEVPEHEEIVAGVEPVREGPREALAFRLDLFGVAAGRKVLIEAFPAVTLPEANPAEDLLDLDRLGLLCICGALGRLAVALFALAEIVELVAVNVALFTTDRTCRRSRRREGVRLESCPEIRRVENPCRQYRLFLVVFFLVH